MQAQGLQLFWLRNERFDSFFMVLPLCVGIVSAAMCVMEPAFFPIILFVDLWLLGYHHVISTYTRIAFDRASVNAHRFLVLALPWLVLAGTLGLYQLVGSWVIATVYLYWQWFHYTRQSYGVSRYYLSRGTSCPALYRPLHTLALYALPVTGILYRSWQAPETFLYMDLKVIPVSYEVVLAAAAASVVLIGLQIRDFWKLYRQGGLHGTYVLFMLSHHVIFAVSYILIDDINFGWLAVNMWHNMQYILFVWMQNNHTYRGGVDPQHRLISHISQNGRIVMYMGVCLGITLALYLGLLMISKAIQASSVISAVLIVFMTLNFHHYIVDAMIWRRKKKPV